MRNRKKFGRRIHIILSKKICFTGLPRKVKNFDTISEPLPSGLIQNFTVEEHTEGESRSYRCPKSTNNIQGRIIFLRRGV